MNFNFAVLEHRLNCTPFVSPVCLPKARDEPEIYENVRAVAIGWGTVNVSTGEMPEKLQVIIYEIVSSIKPKCDTNFQQFTHFVRQNLFRTI